MDCNSSIPWVRKAPPQISSSVIFCCAKTLIEVSKNKNNDFLMQFIFGKLKKHSILVKKKEKMVFSVVKRANI